MSYTPTNWKSGDVVTSAKLNKLEQGVADAGGGSLVVNATIAEDDTGVCDKTMREIWTAAQTGPILLHEAAPGGAVEVYSIATVKYFNGGYSVSGMQEYTAESLDEYPQFGGK